MTLCLHCFALIATNFLNRSIHESESSIFFWMSNQFGQCNRGIVVQYSSFVWETCGHVAYVTPPLLAGTLPFLDENWYQEQWSSRGRARYLNDEVLRVAVSPSRSRRLGTCHWDVCKLWLHRWSASPLSSNDASGALISLRPTVFICILAQVDFTDTWVCIICIYRIYHVLKEISCCSSGLTILACIATDVVNYSYDIIWAGTFWWWTWQNQAVHNHFALHFVLDHTGMISWHLKARGSTVNTDNFLDIMQLLPWVKLICINFFSGSKLVMQWKLVEAIKMAKRR